MVIFPNIGFYPHISNISSAQTIPLDMFLQSIREGDYQDIVLPVRATQDSDRRKFLKDQLPSVTVSGVFSSRYDKNLVKHSGFIAVDVDKLGINAEAFKDMIAADPYTYAAFTSVSGMGVCIIVQIEPDRHRDAYLGLAKYYLDKYRQPIDPTGVNPSRPRFISYDPNIVWNTHSTVFKKYLPKEKKRSIPPVVFVQTEFDDIIRQIVERRVQCCEEYRDWIKVCFALCNRFGESGRAYFHQLSAISSKYSAEVCDKQYDVAMLHESMWSGDRATLATIYWHAKNAGINIASEKTKQISAATTALKKSGLSKETIIKNLEKFDGIPAADSEHIVAQAYDSGGDFHNDDSCLIDSLLAWLRANYNIRFNQVTRRLEHDGQAIGDIEENSIFLNAKRVFDDLTFELFKRCIMSNNIPHYHPFKEWYENNKDVAPNNEIMRFWRCIPVETQADFDRMVYFGTKWLVSIVASIYGDPSPLVLVLAGEMQGTGKTEVFRRLLPKEWREPVDYYAESKLDGKESDDAVLLCTKLIVLDDEFGGQSKKEQRRFKALTSKDTFSVRRAYGRNYEDLKRLAILGGTCNELEVLNDPTGDQRRLIPIHVINRINYEEMNKIDRVAMWVQLFRMYEAGFNYKILSTDITHLAANSEKFTEYSLEYEVIKTYFEVPKGAAIGQIELTAGEIKIRMEAASGQRLNINKIGQELKRLGFTQTIKKRNGTAARIYSVIETKPGGPGYTPLQDVTEF